MPTRDKRSRFATATLLVGALALALGCGGKGNKDPKKPGSKDATEFETTNPDTSGAVTTTGPQRPPKGNGELPKQGDGPEQPDDPGSTEDPKDDEFELPPPKPRVEPPVVDISEAEARAKAASHVKAARAALTGSNKDPNAAIKSAREALAVDTNNIEAVVLLAHAYYFRKLYSTAEVTLRRAVTSPNKKIANQANQNAYLWYVLGLCYDATDEPEKALLAYQRAYDKDKNHKGAIMNLGVHYIVDSRYDEAAQLFAHLTGTLGVRTAPAYTNLASAYRGQSASASIGAAKRNELLLAAETNYKRAIDANKNYAPAYYNIGLLYMDAKPFPLGGKAMDELVRLERAKTYFGEYRALPGAEIARVDEMIRQVDKAIKKEKKARKNANDDW